MLFHKLIFSLKPYTITNNGTFYEIKATDYENIFNEVTSKLTIKIKSFHPLNSVYNLEIFGCFESRYNPVTQKSTTQQAVTRSRTTTASKSKNYLE